MEVKKKMKAFNEMFDNLKNEYTNIHFVNPLRQEDFNLFAVIICSEISYAHN